MVASRAENAPRDGVILWDVDGTLVQVASARQDKHRAAAESVLGRQIDAPASWTGRTDAEILRGLARAAGDPFTRSTSRAMLAELDRLTRIELEELPTIATPGAEDALRQTALRGWINGVATGNSEGRAHAKLACAGLSALIDFGTGFFGSQHEHRDALLADAATSLRRRWHAIPVVVVGDTPLDVTAAKGAGLRVVAVASGVFTHDELAGTDPDLCLADLTSGLAELLGFLARPTRTVR